MKSLVTIFSAALVAFTILPAHADGIKGSKIYSTLTANDSNGIDASTSNYSTTTFLRIGPGTEYTATSEIVSGNEGTVKKPKYFDYTNTYTANFNGNNSILRVDDTCAAAAGATVSNSCKDDVYAPFQMVFTDEAFLGHYLVVENGGAGYDVLTLVGDTLTIHYTGGSAPDQLKLYFAADTPEPSAFVLLGTGIVALAFFGRRRLAFQAAQ